jgi:hypothetical protein
VDLQTPCRKPLKQFSPFAQVLQPRDNSSDSKIYSILKRLSHEVSGSGFECSMEKHSIRTYMDFVMGTSQIYKIDQFLSRCTNSGRWYAPENVKIMIWSVTVNRVSIAHPSNQHFNG